jgi:hypothetical protein
MGSPFFGKFNCQPSPIWIKFTSLPCVQLLVSSSRSEWVCTTTILLAQLKMENNHRRQFSLCIAFEEMKMAKPRSVEGEEIVGNRVASASLSMASVCVS